MTHHATVRRCVANAVQAVLDAYRPGVVAWDTETTGLRGAVIQAAVVELDARGNEQSVLTGIVRPPRGYALERGAVAVHGITPGRIDAEGQEDVPAFLRPLVGRLKRARASGTRVVAHNAAFDVGRMNETLRAWEMPERLEAEDVFCTMRGAKRHCGLVGRTGAPRCPKNAELYALLTGHPEPADETLHDAAADARLTAQSYLAGRRKGWWE